MDTFMQRFGKRALAVIGVLLMVVFILPPTFGDGGGGGRGRSLGRVDGEPLTVAEVDVARQRLLLAQNVGLVIGPNFLPLPVYALAASSPNQLAALGDASDVVGRLANDPVAYALLLREADRLGVSAGPEAAQEFFDTGAVVNLGTGRPVAFDELSNERKRQVTDAVSRFLDVLATFEHVAAGAARASTPLAERELARQFQRLTLDVVPFLASDYAVAVGEPTDEQLRELFTTYAATPAGVVTLENPFGFGYREPAGIRYHYVAVTPAEIERAVRASRDEYAWEVAARRHYLENRDAYRRADADATTSPPFDQVREQAVTAVFAPEIERLRTRLLTLIRQRLSAEANPSFDVLRALADEIERESGVRLTIGDRTDRFHDAASLVAEPGVGAATRQGTPASVTSLLTPAPNEPSAPAPAPAPGTADGTTGEPVPPPVRASETFVTSDGTVYVLRVIERRTDRPAIDGQIDRERLADDWRRREAYLAAERSARETLATQGGPTAMPGRAVQTVGPFGLEDASLPGIDFGPPGPVADAARRAFAGGAFDLLSLPEGRADVIAVPAAGRAYVAGVRQITPEWTDEPGRQRLLTAMRAMLRRVPPDVPGRPVDASTTATLVPWFDPDAVTARSGFVPADGRVATTTGAPADAPAAPPRPRL